jgi:hypothetical protein
MNPIPMELSASTGDTNEGKSTGIITAIHSLSNVPAHMIWTGLMYWDRFMYRDHDRSTWGSLCLDISPFQMDIGVG